MLSLDRYEDVPSTNLAKDCFLATQLLSQAIVTDQLSHFFQDLNQKINLNSIPRSISVQKLGRSNEIIASLNINFSGNQLATYFQGKQTSIKLSCALGITRDLAEIFAKIQSSITNLALEDDLTCALTATESSTSDTKITIDGKEVIASYPLNGRVVLSANRGQSSMPLEMIQNCTHLFNREFAQSICPLLDLDSNVNSLLDGIYKLYLGRCILGLGKSIATQSHYSIGHTREFHRIASLIKIPGSAFYTEPLL